MAIFSLDGGSDIVDGSSVGDGGAIGAVDTVVGSMFNALTQVLRLAIDESLVNLIREATGLVFRDLVAVSAVGSGCGSARGTGSGSNSGGTCTLGASSGLVRDRAAGWDAGGLGCAADAEDGGLPALALGSQVGVLGSLGGYGAGKLDVREDGVVEGHDGLDLGVTLGSTLGLLGLGLGASSDGIGVARED